MLRHFGYSDDLKLPAQLYERTFGAINYDQSIELHSSSIQFLAKVFYQYAEAGFLNQYNFIEIFSTCDELP